MAGNETDLYNDVRDEAQSQAQTQADNAERTLNEAEQTLADQDALYTLLTGGAVEGAPPLLTAAVDMLQTWADKAGVSLSDLAAGKPAGNVTITTPDGVAYGPVSVSSIDEFVSAVTASAGDNGQYYTDWLAPISNLVSGAGSETPDQVQASIDKARADLETARADVEALGSKNPDVFVPVLERYKPGATASVTVPTSHKPGDVEAVAAAQAVAAANPQMGGKAGLGGGQTANRQAPSQAPSQTQAPSQDRAAEIRAEIDRMKQHPSQSKSFTDRLAALQQELKGLETAAGQPNDPNHNVHGTSFPQGYDPNPSSDTGTQPDTTAGGGAGGYTGGGGGGGGAPSVAGQQQANQSAVQQILAEQFGGFSFFLQHNNTALNVGLTADGTIVDWQDPQAVSTKNILDVIVEKGIVAPTRVIGVLQKTEWWQNTDAQMRSFDTQWADMSQPQKDEYLQPVIEALNKEADFVGTQLDPAAIYEEARKLARLGETDNQEMLRGWIVAEGQKAGMGNDMSSFAAARDSVKAMASKYFTPIGDADATDLAEKVYVGADGWDDTKLEQYFKTQATARFPSLDHAINELGLSPNEYFAPYRYQIETMLDRPNVDILNEFPDIIDYVPNGAKTGTQPRPMTLGEVRTYIRGRDEWQNSTQGKDSAQALSFALGKTFGEVA